MIMAVTSKIHSRQICELYVKSSSSSSRLALLLLWCWWVMMVTRQSTPTIMAFDFAMPGYYTTSTRRNRRGRQSAYYSHSCSWKNNSINNNKPTIMRSSFLTLNGNTNNKIDFQCDTENYGRGDFHLSAALSEHDVIVYQTGTWFVDGVLVGDDSLAEQPSFEYAVVDNLQIVWTHNCEHGVIRAWKMHLLDIIMDDRAVQLLEDDKQQFATLDNMNCQQQQRLVRTNEQVDFGPEQLVARIPVKWLGSNEIDNDQQGSNTENTVMMMCVVTVNQELKDDLWRNPPFLS